MKPLKKIVRALIPGGILSPKDLLQIIEIVEAMGKDYFFLGSRQDIIFPLGEDYGKIPAHTGPIRIEHESEDCCKNIVSSYVAAEMLPSTSWVNPSTYLYLLETFDFAPRLKVNLCDPKQNLVPLFTGNLNFVASEYEDFWYLYLRFDDRQRYPSLWPVLINTWDIAQLVKMLEGLFPGSNPDSVKALFREVSQAADINTRTYPQEPEFAYPTFPDYEGMNKIADDRYWLGLYWRNNQYATDFFRALACFCMENNIGKICITPWKSVIIKGISEKNKAVCERILGRYGINPRHSSLELNWHLPVMDQEALDLKRYLVRAFDQNDICTQGLTFSVKNEALVLFTSVVIEKNPPSQYADRYDLRPTYNVLHCREFNPNRHHYLTYAQDVEKEDLPGILMQLSKAYYARFYGVQELPMPKAAPEPETYPVFRCKHCLSVYDSHFGDPGQTIPAGTLFEALPDTYHCPLCEASRAAFEPVLLPV